MASVLRAQQRYAEAINLAERALSILRQSPDSSEVRLAGTMSSLGNLFLLAGRIAEAEACAREAVSSVETAYGPESPRVADCLRIYAAALKRMNRKEEARTAESRANAILDRMPGSATQVHY